MSSLKPHQLCYQVLDNYINSGILKLLVILHVTMFFNLCYYINAMSDDTEAERFFRERYAQELRKKKQEDSDSYQGNHELAQERIAVKQQEMKTPGRRGEKIKHEEIDKEILRRSKIKEKKSPER